MKNTEEFRIRLKKALAQNNMKPVDLSKKTGISKSTISQYRSDYSKPKIDRLIDIANALHVNPAWLMGFDAQRSEEMKEKIVSANIELEDVDKYMEKINRLNELTAEIMSLWEDVKSAEFNVFMKLVNNGAENTDADDGTFSTQEIKAELARFLKSACNEYENSTKIAIIPEVAKILLQ